MRFAASSTRFEERKIEDCPLRPAAKRSRCSSISGSRTSSSPIVAYEAYEVIVRVHLIPSLGKRKLDTLTAQHVQSMLNAKRKDGASGRTLQNIRAILRAALNQALRWDLVSRNVVTLTDAPDLGNFEAKPIAAEDVGKLLNAASNTRLETLWTLTAWLGLRQGEVFGLRWQDVDFDGSEIRIR